MQLEWLGFRQEQEVISLPRPAIAILDYRQEADLRTALLRWMAGAADSTVQVWAEGPNLPKGGGLEAVLRGRDELAPCEALAIWTTPPSGPELRQALERSRPSQVALFAIDPGLDSPEAFLTRLAGLVKYALGRGGGQASLPRLAAAMASREAAVRLGLEWLAARGLLRIAMIEETGIVLSSGGEPDPARLAQLSADLEALLLETRSYRKYFGRAESSALIAG
jgi:hypothetical protein